MKKLEFSKDKIFVEIDGIVYIRKDQVDIWLKNAYQKGKESNDE